MTKNSLILGLLSPFFVFSQVGINTATPQETLHVNGGLQITRHISTGGNAQTPGDTGNSGDVLVSQGNGNPPIWKDIDALSGTIYSVNYVQGTTSLTINEGNTADVPGVTLTLTVPTGRTQTFLFTITGYAVQAIGADEQASQGVFSLLQNNTKIASAYASSADAGSLNNVPTPSTLLKSVSLDPGTYTFKVQYTSWSVNQRVNFVPSIFLGYNGDSEAMLTKMQVLVYNN